MVQKLGPWILVAALFGFFAALFIVFKVLDTQFFRGDPELGGSASPVRNDQTLLAYTHCAAAAAKQPGPLGDGARTLPEYTAWDIGFSRFLVKATLENPAAPGQGKAFICKILDRDGSTEGWAVESIEYLN